MQSHLMNKRRSEVSVAPLRPLALNRATSEILPYRGTLFLKGEPERDRAARGGLVMLVGARSLLCVHG